MKIWTGQEARLTGNHSVCEAEAQMIFTSTPRNPMDDACGGPRLVGNLRRRANGSPFAYTARLLLNW